ncbi:IclR family transcriptional regulator [Nocardia lijiangensis]|uniref:IclR family transcriptional regulator n=1 Tax=Nocardia lijiangensis TaxID=299618 RepID=UPI0008349D5D|nr:IclR family transcriptional regulator [Nocardia lijiangensis]
MVEFEESGPGEPLGDASRTSVLNRSAAILEAVALHGSWGARLIDVTQATGLTRPTVHRILQELIEIGYIEQRAKKYRLGPALYALGLSAPSPIGDYGGIERCAQRLADSTGDTVYVAIRQLGGLHYLLRAEGSYPIRARVVDVGETVPLGVTYAGIALLAWHAPEDVEAQLRANEPRRKRLGFDVSNFAARLSSVRRQIIDVRQHGWCFDTDTVLSGVTGMAAPVPSRTRRPYMAITISAINDRLPPERIRALREPLLGAAREITNYIA